MRDIRLTALRRFAVAITVLNILGHAVLGFEQAVLVPIVALITAYVLELGLELLDASVDRRPLRFNGGFRHLVDFLLPAHITGLAVSMLLYANSRIWPIVFAVTVAICSKALFRIRFGSDRSRHFLNPSNTGIAVTLLLFPWVSIAPPYHFTEDIDGWLDWLLPALIMASGTFLNAKLTRKMPLILAWVLAFGAQATIRALTFDTPIAAGLFPITGVAFVLFTNYMITDPATTPAKALHQVVFGGSTAVVYGVLMLFHVAFGLFFALVIVCAGRGVVLWVSQHVQPRVPALDLAVFRPQPQKVDA